MKQAPPDSPIVRRAGSALALVVGCSLACGGGVGAPAPVTPYADEATCPSVDASQDRVVAYVRGADGLKALAPVLDTVLVEERGIIPLVTLGLGVLQQVGADRLWALGASYTDAGGLGALTPHLHEVLKYTAGQSDYFDTSHEGVVDVVAAILNSQSSPRCDPLVFLRAIEAMAALNYAEGAWLEAVSQRVQVLAGDEAFVALLSAVSFDDDDGDIVVGRDAFVLIARLLFANIAAPDFNPDDVRVLIDDVLLAQFIDDDVVADKLSALIDVLMAPFAAQSAAKVPFTEVIGCWDAADEEGALPEMLFDYLRTEELALDVFLNDLDAFAAGSAGDIAQPLATDLTGALLANPVRLRDAATVLARFLHPEHRARTLGAIIEMKGRGVASGVLDLWAGVAEGCTPP